MAADPITPLLDVTATEEFKEHSEAVKKALGYANRFATEDPIASQEEANELADAVRGLVMTRKAIHETRLATSAKYRATTDAINVHYNELATPVDASEDALKDKALNWQRAVEARALEEARQRQAEIDKEAERLAAEAQEAQELADAEDEDAEEFQKLADETRQEAAAAATAPPARVIEPPKQARGAHGKLGARKVMRFDVTDDALVPVQFKVTDRGMIKARIKAEVDRVKATPGATFNLEIPGVHIWADDLMASGGASR